MDKIIIIAIYGPAGSGKDYLLRSLKDLNKDIFHPIVNETTRPMRENEVEGVDYHFLSAQDFACKVFSGEMLQAKSFNGWYYGTSFASLDENKINIGIFSPEAIEAICLNSRCKVYAVRIMADDKVRMLRQLSREENPDIDEIVRRWTTDRQDFADGIECPNVIYYYNGYEGITEEVSVLYERLEELFDFGQFC